jgi:hypothetical protein
MPTATCCQIDSRCAASSDRAVRRLWRDPERALGREYPDRMTRAARQHDVRRPVGFYRLIGCTQCAHYRGAACPHERPASCSP